MAKVLRGFLLGTHDDLTFYLMDGELYVRMKSSLSRKKVKYSPRFVRTMQSAEELRRASKLASRIYWELSKEQKKRVFVLYKRLTGVAKIAFKYGKSEEEAEREVREYLIKEGVVKRKLKVEEKYEEEVVRIVVKKAGSKTDLTKRKRVDDQRNKLKMIEKAPRVFALPAKDCPNRDSKSVCKNFRGPDRYGSVKKRVLLFDG